MQAEPKGNFPDLREAGLLLLYRVLFCFDLFVLIEGNIRTGTCFSFAYGTELTFGIVPCLVEVHFGLKASHAYQLGSADHSIFSCSHLPMS